MAVKALKRHSCQLKRLAAKAQLQVCYLVATVAVQLERDRVGAGGGSTALPDEPRPAHLAAVQAVLAIVCTAQQGAAGLV